MPLKVIQFAPFSKGKIPRCYRLKQSRFAGVIRTRQNDMAGDIECYLIKTLESADDNLGNHSFASLRRFYHQQLIPPVVDHLHRNLSMFSRLKRCADRSGKMVPDTFFMRRLQRPFQIVPCACAREKCLADMEAEAVVIGIEEPCRDIVTFSVSTSIVTGSKTSSPRSSTSYKVFPSPLAGEGEGEGCL